jgi:hypothetical protein
VIETHPVELIEATDNGITYENGAWFKFNKTTLFSIVSSYPKFYDLLIRAGLIDPKNYKFTFISEGDYYTVFAPTDDALINAGVDTLDKDDLENLLRYHFVRDELIFTDGKKLSGFYETARIDESSNEFSIIFSKINLDIGVDYINVLDQDGNLYYQTAEEEGKTNIMTTTDVGDDNDNSIWNFITTGVLHEVDTVFVR